MTTNKALVEIIVPAADKKFDLYIPFESKMSQISFLVSAALSELSDGKFKGSENSIICDADSGVILDVNMTVAELGIRNGSKLMLI